MILILISLCKVLSFYIFPHMAHNISLSWRISIMRINWLRAESECYLSFAFLCLSKGNIKCKWIRIEMFCPLWAHTICNPFFTCGKEYTKSMAFKKPLMNLLCLQICTWYSYVQLWAEQSLLENFIMHLKEIKFKQLEIDHNTLVLLLVFFFVGNSRFLDGRISFKAKSKSDHQEAIKIASMKRKY